MEYYVAVKLYCCHSIAYSTLRFLRVFWSLPPIKLTARNNRNIVENGVEHHNPKK